MSEHRCHAKDCAVEVPPKLLMCARHWRMVPKVTALFWFCALALSGLVLVLIYLAVVAVIWPVMLLLSRGQRLNRDRQCSSLSESERRVLRLGLREVLK